MMSWWYSQWYRHLHWIRLASLTTEAHLLPTLAAQMVEKSLHHVDRNHYNQRRSNTVQSQSRSHHYKLGFPTHLEVLFPAPASQPVCRKCVWCNQTVQPTSLCSYNLAWALWVRIENLSWWYMNSNHITFGVYSHLFCKLSNHWRYGSTIPYLLKQLPFGGRFYLWWRPRSNIASVDAKPQYIYIYILEGATQGF